MRPLAMATLAFLAVVFAGATAAASTITYTYNALGRLATVTYADGTVITYAYDAAGNRTVYTVTP